MWRGPNWRPSLPNPKDDDTKATKINVDSGNFNKMTLGARKLSVTCLQKNRTEHLCNEPLDIRILSNSGDLSLHKTVPCLTENSNPPVSDVSAAASLPMKTCDVEITEEDVMAFSCIPQMVSGTNKSSASIVADPHSNKFLDGSEANVSEPSSCAPCTEGLLLLLDQAVEQGCALVLDDKFLDDDYIYQTTVTFSKSTPPEPLYKLPDRL